MREEDRLLQKAEKFLIDADLPNSTVKPFREHGFPTTHVREIDMGDDLDPDIAEYANRKGYTLVTRDRDFGNPLLHNRIEEGIIIVKLHNYSPSKLERR